MVSSKCCRYSWMSYGTMDIIQTTILIIKSTIVKWREKRKVKNQGKSKIFIESSKNKIGTFKWRFKEKKKIRKVKIW